ncbi:actin, cytoplasmic-like [Rhinoderma darwinii]|uniref:actin, cytoplasmic-like n=1 Tax=Rhinoderma darwinii TaxID=43563 RepID=UPI003F660FBB
MMEFPAVIFDNGSGLCKAGIAGDVTPKSVFTSVVGRSRVRSSMFGIEQKECYIGDDAQSRRGVLTLTYPVERGIITSWDGIEKIWTYVYDRELRLKASDRPVLLTEVPLNPLQNREKMAEIMFEGFNVPGMYIALQATLTLYSSGTTTGMFVNSGDGVTHMVPVYEGYSMPHAVARLDVAGRDVTECLMRLLLEIGHTFVSSAEREIARDIKEHLCYVQWEPKENLREARNVYCLPDGNTVSLGSQLFRAPEILFAPANIGIEAPGMHELLYRSIMKCPIDVRKDLYNNIVLSGGTTLFPGLNERISQEMEFLVPNGVTVKTILPENRQYSVWIGASIISSLSVFRDLWVTSSDYKEIGSAALHKKCF